MTQKVVPQIARPDLAKIQLNTGNMDAKVAGARHRSKGAEDALHDGEERLVQEDLAVLNDEINDSVADRIILAQAGDTTSDAAPAAAGSVSSAGAGSSAPTGTTSDQGSEPVMSPLMVGVAGAFALAAAAGGGGGSSGPLPDTTAPAAPVINPVTPDNIINAAETGATITGTAEANSGVTLALAAGNTHAVTADAAGNWSYTLQPADIAAMGEGAETLSAAATDAAGNVSAPGTRAITIDTVAPAVPVIDQVAGDDVINAGETGVAITGTAEANSTVALTLGAGNVHTVTADGSGNWSYTLVGADITAMGQGAETLSATATDAAGNVSAAGTHDITVDTVAPAAPVIDLVAGDEVINASETGTTLTGSAEANSTVALTLGAGNVHALTADGSGNWGYTLVDADIAAMGQGNVTLSATATDAAGNVSAAGTRDVTVDTIAPTATAAITAVADNVAPVVGNLTTGGWTNDTSLDLSGTISGPLGAGEVLVVYDGATRLGTTTIDAGGTTWTYTDSLLANGDAVSYTVRAEDAAGNQGAASAAFTANIDTLAPTATADITQVLDNYGGLTESLTSGVGTTDDTSLDLSGTISDTLAANEMVVVYDGATRLGTATAGAGNTWSFTDTTLASGDVTSYTVRVEDAAGNQGAASVPAFVATISAPTGTTTITGAADNVGSIQGNVISGGTTDDPQVHLSGTVTGLTGLQVVGVWDGATRLGSAFVINNTWTYLDNRIGLPDGHVANYTASVELLDIFVPSGTHRGVASNTYTVNIDTTAPAVSDAGFGSGGAATSFDVTYNEGVLAPDAGGITASQNGATALTVTGATPGTVVNPDDTLTLAFTGATLAATDYVVLSYNATTGGITDTAGNPAASGTMVFGSTGTPGAVGTTIDLVANPLTGTVYSPVYIRTHQGDDTITGTASAEVIQAGAGADTINSGGGADTFVFAQGDSTAVTFAYVNDGGVLDNGDTFTFTGGADIINSAAAGSSILLGANLTSVALANDGTVGDQQYATARGNYAGGVFTMDTAAGTDVLVVYDGDATAGVAQTALVLSGGAALNLTQNTGQIAIA